MADSDIEILDAPPPRQILSVRDIIQLPDPLEVDDDLAEYLEHEIVSNRLLERERTEGRRRQREHREQRRRSPAAAPGGVIDLTEEPDSPPARAAAAPQPQLTLPDPHTPHPSPRIRAHQLQPPVGQVAHNHHHHHRHHHHHHHHHHGHDRDHHHRRLNRLEHPPAFGGSHDPAGRNRPESLQAEGSAQAAARHPRRQMSGLGRTPSLARSDASINGGSGNNNVVIDLTGIDDAPAPAAPAVQHVPPPPRPPPIPLPMALPPTLPRPDGLLARFGAIPDALLAFPGNLGVANRLHQMLNIDAERRMRANIPSVIDLNYGANGFGGVPPPKPVYEPPAAAPEGFSRDTGEDVVAVCPACDQELVFDPDEVAPPTPSGKKKAKKDRAEHHFMAVKACGHVYCRKCFDNRVRLSKTDKSNFKAASKGKTVICAVEGCTSEVGLKSAWLGIFT